METKNYSFANSAKNLIDKNKLDSIKTEISKAAKPETKTQTSKLRYKSYNELSRAFEKAYKKGDYYLELDTLARIATYSILNTCIDPQRKTAIYSTNPTNGGLDSTLIQSKIDLTRDLQLIDNARIDDDTNEYLSSQTLGNGIDIYQKACLTYIEYADKYKDKENFLDYQLTKNMLDKRVVIHSANSAKWKNVTLSINQWIYKDIRQYIDSLHNPRTNPANNCLYSKYIMDTVTGTVTDTETSETQDLYVKADKYANLGGYEYSYSNYGSIHQNKEKGTFVCDTTTTETYYKIRNELIPLLNRDEIRYFRYREQGLSANESIFKIVGKLSEKQALIYVLHTQYHYGLQAIASFLGMEKVAIQDTLKAVDRKGKRIERIINGIRLKVGDIMIMFGMD